MLLLTAEKEYEGMRLDVFMSECGELTRSAAQKLIEDG
jgi:RNA-binding protein YlmH